MVLELMKAVLTPQFLKMDTLNETTGISKMIIDLTVVY